jgi:hypothetical protein
MTGLAIDRLVMLTVGSILSSLDPSIPRDDTGFRMTTFVILSLSKYFSSSTDPSAVPLRFTLRMTTSVIDRLVMLTKEASFHYRIPRFLGMTELGMTECLWRVLFPDDKVLIKGFLSYVLKPSCFIP